jgi:hypothetical protein
MQIAKQSSSHLTRRLFGSMLRRIAALPLLKGWARCSASGSYA